MGARRWVAQKNVLVAGDDPWTRRLVAELMGKGDYAVMQLSSGNSPLRPATHIPPHLIPLDLMLPERSGPGLLRTA